VRGLVGGGEGSETHQHPGGRAHAMEAGGADGGLRHGGIPTSGGGKGFGWRMAKSRGKVVAREGWIRS
jgi:hypothetical protein